MGRHVGEHSQVYGGADKLVGEYSLMGNTL